MLCHDSSGDGAPILLAVGGQWEGVLVEGKKWSEYSNALDVGVREE